MSDQGQTPGWGWPPPDGGYPPYIGGDPHAGEAPAAPASPPPAWDYPPAAGYPQPGMASGGNPPYQGWPPDGGYLPPGEMSAPTPRRHGKLAVLVSSVVAIMLIATLVLVVVLKSNHNEANRAAGLVPVDAFAFASVSLEPSLLQRKDLFQIAQKFPKARAKIQGSFDQAKDNLLTDALKSVCLDYRKDVKPWLGSELAVAVLPSSPSPQPVVLVRVKDEAKARTALDTATKRPCHQPSADATAPAPPPAYRIVSGFAVISASTATAGLDAVAADAARHDGGLAKTARFTAAVNQLHGDRLAFGWVDLGALAQLQKSSIGGFHLPASCGLVAPSASAGAAAFSFFATPNTLALEGVSQGAGAAGQAAGATLTQGLPADSSAALTVFDLGGIVHRALSCFGGSGPGTNGPLQGLTDRTGINLDADVLPWMHGETVAVVGPNRGAGKLPGFGLVVAVSDQAKAAAGLAKIRTALAAQGDTMSPQTIGDVPAFVSGRQVSGGVQPAMALVPGRFVLASSPEYLAQLLTPTGSLGATDDYRSVIGTGQSGTAGFQFVVRVAPVRDAIAGNLHGSAADKYRRDVAPYLEPFKAIGLRTWRDGTTGHVQVTISFN